VAGACATLRRVVLLAWDNTGLPRRESVEPATFGAPLSDLSHPVGEVHPNAVDLPIV
jgi:hypothetical protein